jgi:hypothetical protein
MGSPEHLRSSILNYCTMPHPVVRDPHELTRAPPELNTQLLYNAPPCCKSPHELTRACSEFNIELPVQCSTLWQVIWAHPSTPGVQYSTSHEPTEHLRSSIINYCTMPHLVVRDRHELTRACSEFNIELPVQCSTLCQVIMSSPENLRSSIFNSP